jgi:UDP-GlcNAc:undecaprenyl-phosphate GlcNAc-1-phosphate transferase
MQTLAFLGATTFLLSLFLTPVFRNRSSRKTAGKVPRIGGVPVVLACVLGCALVLSTGLKGNETAWAAKGLILHLLGPALLLFTIGLIDDLRRVEPWHKVACQVFAAFLAYWAGVRMQVVAGHHLGGWSLPLTVVWILLCCTAISMINAIEGLAAGVGVIAAFATFVVALLEKNLVLAVAAIPLAGSILGFLPYDFSPSTILLGESGSLLIGFMLGCYSILSSQTSEAFLSIAVPLLVLVVPFFDTIFVVVRRFIRRQPFAATDNSHIYHRLLNRGFSPRKVMIVLYVYCAISAIVSLLILHSQSLGLVIVLFCAAAWIWIRHISYAEFSAARRMLMEGSYRRKLHAEITLRSYESRLKAASTPEEYWAVAVEGLNEFGFYEAQLSIAGSTFEWRSDAPAIGSWEVSVPIAEFDCMRLSRAFDTGAHAHGFAPFVDLLRRSLTVKRGLFLSYNRARAAAS